MAAPRVIVGAGAAGLSLALMLDEPVTLYEKAEPGGLCRSTRLDGFTFDTGPHILGGIPHAVDWVVESTGIEYVEGHTRNVGWRAGQFVPHPFEDPRVGERYMEKMWKVPPRQLVSPGLGAQAGRKPGGVSTFLYPAHGGYQAITDAWAARLNDSIVHGTADPEPGTVWTAPVQGGRYNTLALVTFGFEGVAPAYTAIYLPDSVPCFHRLSFPSAFAPGNAPGGCFTIQGEASFPPGATVPDNLIGLFEDTLDRVGIGGPVVFEHAQVVPHAYPVPHVDAAPRAPEGTIGHGRTGAHRYLNVDGVVGQSMTLAARLNRRVA